MKYISTRESKTEKNAAQAIIAGIAEDKGLYVPEYIPRLPISLEELTEMQYPDVAKKIIGAFFDDYTEEELTACIDGAYRSGKFAADDVVNVAEAGGAYFLELYHGRTAAFKDMALSILPYLLTTALKKEREDSKICILTATSGDTGKAALEGFADVPGTEIIVFFPENGVSEVQKQQMVTQEGANTHVFAVKGNFDDAQTGVKKIFNDKSFAGKLKAKGCKLSSANSINIGRLVPQVAYYVYGYGRLVANGAIKAGDKINIAVPTGNFGNILAAYYAKEMGLPVKKLICASNKNRVLTDFLNTGIYDTKREFYLTNSPSMDILVSSNLERLLFHLSGQDGAEIGRLMTQLDTSRKYEINAAIKKGLEAFACGSASVEETNEAIGLMYGKYGYLMDTHTAVGYKVYMDYVNETGDKTPTLIASTASAYKFADSVGKSIGLPEGKDGFESIESLNKACGVPIPEGLKGLVNKKIRHKSVIEISEMPKSVYDAI